jgi:HSP20 family protein
LREEVIVMNEIAKNDQKRCLAPCDIYKEGDKVVLRMEMPGVNKEGLSISIDDDLLVIEGRKELEDIQGEYRVREIKEGNFYHEFTLDDTIDRKDIDAAMDCGILTLTLKMKESEKPRTIKVISG